MHAASVHAMPKQTTDDISRQLCGLNKTTRAQSISQEFPSASMCADIIYT